MDRLDNLMNETERNVSAATENVNNISSYSSQLKLQLSKTKELYPRETNEALKKTAENLLELIASNTKENNVSEQGGPTPFLEFKSKMDERLASIDGILTAVGCIIRNE